MVRGYGKGEFANDEQRKAVMCKVNGGCQEEYHSRDKYKTEKSEIQRRKTKDSGSNQLKHHSSPESAYVVEDYPYGRRRTKMRYWIEHKDKHGDRLCRQSLNPKTGKWNNPKKSTYSSVKVLVKNPKNGHVETDELSTWSKEERVKEFMSKYDLTEKQKKICKQLIVMDRASKHIKYEIKPHDSEGPSHEEIEKKNMENWNKAMNYEYYKAKKNKEI